MDAPVLYIANFWDVSSDTCNAVDACIPWEQRQTARAESFMSDEAGIEYTYGKSGFERKYVSVATPGLIRAVMDKVDEVLSEKLDMCFANKYITKLNHLGWHKDDSPDIDHGKGIAIVSFGAEREIWFRNNETNVVDKLLLGNGSLAVMKAGMQFTHQHRIPKHSADCGTRVSLTMRARL